MHASEPSTLIGRGNREHSGHSVRRFRGPLLGAGLFVVAVLAGSCGSSTSLPSADRTALQPTGGAPVAPSVGGPPGAHEFGVVVGSGDPTRPIGDSPPVESPALPPIEVRSAVTLDRLAMSEPAVGPTALRIESVGIEAPVRPVGIDAAGEYELPPGSEIGWYRFGPTPGDAGSSVLAAHVDWNGRPGAFFELQDAQIGDRVTVSYDDRSEASFVIVDVNRYAKSELPLDSLFERSGEPRLTLITCGGDFNPGLRSYEDNIVVIAEPVS